MLIILLSRRSEFHRHIEVNGVGVNIAPDAKS